MIHVVEIFRSIQGEGSNAGRPSVFVRFGLCNLTCPGFGCTETAPDGTEILGCDSIHAVSSKFINQWTKYHNFIELTNDINNEIIDGQVKDDIIITGGEPMIHTHNEIFRNMIKYYTTRGHQVYIETNATQTVDFEKYPELKKVIFTMSIKLASSGHTRNETIKPDVIDSYIANTTGSSFKFVLNKDTLEETERDIQHILKSVPSYAEVYVMPMGETTEELQVHALPTFNVAMKYGFNYSDRLHIRLFEDLKGV